MAGTTVLRQTLKLGAGCGNSACPELSGWRGVTLFPTGIERQIWPNIHRVHTCGESGIAENDATNHKKLASAIEKR